MKVLIIEDEQHTANRLVSLLNSYDNEIEIISILSSVSESIDWFKSNKKPDLIFQDIELSDGQCFEIFQNTQIESPIIFTTAYSEFALKAFEVNSIGYIVKPYDISDIKKVMDKFMSFSDIFRISKTSLIQDVLQNENRIEKKRFLVRSGDNFKSYNAQDISYIISKDGLNFAYTHNSEYFIVDQSLNEIAEILDRETFYRINRNCIINHKSIVKISKWFNNRLKITVNPESRNELIVSRERVKDFKIWLGA